MPKNKPSLRPGRQSKKRDPEQLWHFLCGLYPMETAAEKFEELMGYDPRMRFRVPELKDYLDITISEERK